MSRGLTPIVLAAVVLTAGVLTPPSRAAAVKLKPAGTRDGFLARLLINEVPFPGEGGYRSVADSKSGMLAILWVLHSRIYHIPAGYSQRAVATVSTKDIIDVITAGGVKGQVDGFYKDKSGNLKMVSRVHERTAHLTKIGNQGKPGRFADLLNYGQELASRYLNAGPAGPDIFAELRRIGASDVTGRAYSWMTDDARYSPGGKYVRIPNNNRGSLAGNRFFTLEESK